LIDVRPAQPISANNKVLECGSPRLATQLFWDDVLSLQGRLYQLSAAFVGEIFAPDDGQQRPRLVQPGLGDAGGTL
jgi:hypothetical protein